VAEEFTLSDSESQTKEAETPNIFDRVTVYDNIIIDEHRHEILFSAGVLPTDNSREMLKKQIHSLEYDCSSLRKMAFTYDDLGLDDGGGDSTVADVIAGL
jgi:hypothetical protein